MKENLNKGFMHFFMRNEFYVGRSFSVRENNEKSFSC